MNASEITNTLSKLQRRIRKSKVYDPDAKKSIVGNFINTKQYYLRVKELECFIMVFNLTNLQMSLQNSTETIPQPPQKPTVSIPQQPSLIETSTVTIETTPPTIQPDETIPSPPSITQTPTVTIETSR